MFVDEEVWGKKRLFSREQWPGLKERDRQKRANQVVDRFHKAMKGRELSVQWKPGLSELHCYGETREDEIDVGKLGQVLERIYGEA